jgi:hypothetical protein
LRRRSNDSRDRRRRTRGLHGLSWRRLCRLCYRRNLSEARTGGGKQQNRSMHGINGGRCYQMRDSGSICFGFAVEKSQRRTGHRARSDIKNAMLRNTPFPRSMRNFLLILALVLSGFAGTTFADDFKSITFTSPQMIRVHGDQFMVIRNFTQEVAGSSRGVVMVAKPPTSSMPVSVLAAAIVDPMNTPQGTLEVINSVVIAGPAEVTFTCGASGGNCFISYKKDDN